MCTLPSRALLLIHEYSRPVTRGNWRKSKPIITTYKLYLCVKYLLYNQHTHNVIDRHHIHNTIIRNIGKTDWYSAYYYILCNGYIQYYLNDYNIISMNIDGIQDAILQYKKNKEINKIYKKFKHSNDYVKDIMMEIVNINQFY